MLNWVEHEKSFITSGPGRSPTNLEAMSEHEWSIVYLDVKLVLFTETLNYSSTATTDEGTFKTLLK